MKYPLIILLLASSAWAQVRLTPTDSGIDLNQVPKEIRIDRETPRTHYLTPTERDVILKKHFSEHIKSFDDVDRDILYKAFINYPKDKLLKKYPFIKEEKYIEVRDELL